MNAFQWNKITSEVRVPDARNNKYSRSYRSEIESDYLRIVRSASFRRLQDKTQVFPLDKSDFVRTRLTHSYEVSAIAKMIGKQVCNEIKTRKLEPNDELPNEVNVIEILNCAGLLHDIGNPPFGHFGEDIIRNWFCQNLGKIKMKDKPLSKYLTPQQILDLEYFEGNAQSLRIVCKLHKLMGEHGMHLTSGVLDTIIKYPCSSIVMKENKDLPKKDKTLLHKKIGYFFSEQDLYQNIKHNTTTMDCRNPLTFILEAADDIAYTFADLEDGYNKGLFTYQDLLETIQTADDEYGENLLTKLLKDGLNTKNEREDRSSVYKTAVFTWLTKKQLYSVSTISEAFLSNYDKIMNGNFEEELINVSKENKILNGLKKLAYDNVYKTSSILKLELMGNEIITFLLDRFVHTLVVYDTEQKMEAIDEKYIALLSRNYLDNYHRSVISIEDEGERLYYRLLLATDFIAGMSDSYAQNLYREIKGFSS